MPAKPLVFLSPAQNLRSLSFFVILLILPNFLGAINIPLPLGFHLHFFQAGIFLAALLYGPKAGAVSGLAGSVYSAAIMHNPYLVIGNAILGFFFGLLAKKGLDSPAAAILAFATQLPWLVLTDYYLIGMSAPAIKNLLLSLLLTNLLWAFLAKQLSSPASNFLSDGN